jgi:hypothetical protein
MESSRLDPGLSSMAKHVRIELPGHVKTISDLHFSMSFVPDKARREAFQRQRGSALNAENSLEGRIKGRHISLSPIESVVLHRLLIDEPCSRSQGNPAQRSTETHLLNDDILFSAPNDPAEARSPELMRVAPRRQRQPIMGLWKAHAAGIGPRTVPVVKRIFERSNRTLQSSTVDRQQLPRTRSGAMHSGATTRHPSLEIDRARPKIRRAWSESFLQEASGFSLNYDDFCASDQEVRPKDQNSTCSSFDDDEERTGHFDTWEILSDEYSNDFGFNAHSSPDSVLILGTGAHDTKAHPHVMSPPLLDALMVHLPPILQDENFWLKYCTLCAAHRRLESCVYLDH